MFFGCGRENPPPKAAPPAKPALGRTETTYELKGEVLGLDPKTSSVTIRHEKIPEFMPAMTMSFPLQDPSEMAHLKVGDTVQGSLWVAREKGNVTEFKLSDLAVVSRPLTLRVADGEASLSSSPRRLEPDQDVPDFTMTTQNGTSLRLSDLRGKVVVVTFVYTRCPLPDFCPLQDKKFSELADRLAAVPKRAEQVRLLSVSFDPEHDTPEILEKHAAMRGAKPPLWTYAVAPRSPVRSPSLTGRDPMRSCITSRRQSSIREDDSSRSNLASRGRPPTCSRQSILRSPAQESEKKRDHLRNDFFSIHS
jgi:protein SCO1/2